MRKIILVLVFVMFFVSGCAVMDSMSGLFKNLPGIKQPLTPQGGGKSYVGGTSSVKLNMLQPAENSKISKDVPLRISINVKNEGESQADGQLCVTGLNPAVFEESKSCECQEFSLKGKGRYEDEIVEGEDVTLNFDEGSAKIDEFTINDFSVTSIARFDYKTYASVEGCVTKDIASSKDCKARQDAKIIGVSSAPLQITSVVQELLAVSDEEYTMTLIIEVSHKGDGDFFDTSLDKDSCVEDSNINKKVGVKLINAPGSATCTPLLIKKKDDKGTTTCVITGVQARNYKPMMNVELSYAYEVRESNRFQVV
ncbi:MAG: hypothetical protein QXR60_03025 [Candidatus Nanoarchaeia archaeon]